MIVMSDRAGMNGLVWQNLNDQTLSPTGAQYLTHQGKLIGVDTGGQVMLANNTSGDALEAQGEFAAKAIKKGQKSSYVYIYWMAEAQLNGYVPNMAELRQAVSA